MLLIYDHLYVNITTIYVYLSKKIIDSDKTYKRL